MAPKNTGLFHEKVNTISGDNGYMQSMNSGQNTHVSVWGYFLPRRKRCQLDTHCTSFFEEGLDLRFDDFLNRAKNGIINIMNHINGAAARLFNQVSTWARRWSVINQKHSITWTVTGKPFPCFKVALPKALPLGKN